MVFRRIGGIVRVTALILAVAALGLSAFGEEVAESGLSVDLNGQWELAYFPQPDDGAVRELPLPAGLNLRSVRALVPGNCELDLVRAGVLPEPEVGLNVLKLRPYEGYQWLYSKTFFVPGEAAAGAPRYRSGGRAELVFGGIDTLADVFLNGRKVGTSENMLIERRFDVTTALRAGTNLVQVLLRPVLLDAQHATIGEMGMPTEPGGDGERYRKAAHMGGWDIFPRVFVQGLWRGVSLEVSPQVRLRECVWMLKNLDVARRRAAYIFRARVEAPFRVLDHAMVRCSLSRRGKVCASSEKCLFGYHPVVEFELEKADLWWPKSFGEPALYDAVAEIVSETGVVLARDARRIGVRTIELERDDVYGPERPGQFLFRVNGEPCYIRGSNWVPLDAFHGRDGEHLISTLEMWKDLNCNMVRVWGGGVYESDDFFDWCDENGVMVWQDFMTGCGVFPQDDDYARETREEVLATVLRLRNRASLALWSGNNENDCAFEWCVGKKLARDPNRDRTSRRTIPDILFEYDLTRPYLPSSPYFSPDVVAGRAKQSEDHLWGERAYYKVPFYTNSPAWFASEMGYHGCPNRVSLERMMTGGALYPWKSVSGTNPGKDFHWNDEWQLKACNPGFGCGQLKHATRNNLMVNHCRILFGAMPTDIDDFIWESQFAQSEAMKTFVELFRSRKFTRFNGLIWWNMRDGWPILSDAVVDFYGGRKRAYYTIRNSQQDQLVCVTDDGGVHAVNDTLHSVRGKVRISDRESGRVVFEKSYDVASNAAVRLGTVSWIGQGVLDISYEQDGQKSTNWFLYGEPPFAYEKVREWFK